MSRVLCVRSAECFAVPPLTTTSPHPPSFSFLHLFSTSNPCSPIQTQGVCGSCWAFSTTGAVESHYAIATGSLRKLSEQQLMDCSRTTGSRGCDGGDFDEGFTYITNNGGINSDKDYPYTSTSINCDKLEEKRKVATIDGYINVQREKPLQLMAGIELGPVSVAVSAGQPEWQHYASGVLNFLCAVNVDHAVLAVGYGTTNATGISLSGEYWIIKNSWGAAWGEEGYVRLKRGSDFYHNPVGMCGILTEPSYPNVTHRAPLPVPPPTPSHPSPDTMCNNCGESCEWTCAHDGVPSDPPLVCVSETKTGGLHCECAPVANTGPPPLCAVNASGVVSVVAKV